jgi:hypothetical protein
MGQSSKIFTALSAGAFLLHYPGIFSRLSNDGKQSPALISMPSGSTLALRGCFRLFVSCLLIKNIYKEPTLSMPGFAFQRMDFCFHPTFVNS